MRCLVPRRPEARASGDYVLAEEPEFPSGVGAIELIRSYLNSPTGVNLPKIFGFNEGRSTPDPVVVGARAEAWEFLLNEGGTYDNYNLGFFDAKSAAVRNYLGRLVRFLQPSFNLSAINGRQTGSSPG